MKAPRLEPAFVYRLYDGMGSLLYVGCTAHLRMRWQNHRSSQPWWGQVAHWTITGPYRDRVSAEVAELVAVIEELPRFNADGRARQVSTAQSQLRVWRAANDPDYLDEHHRLAALLQPTA